MHIFNLFPHSWELMHTGKGAMFTHILKSSHDHTTVEHAGLGDCIHIWAPWEWSIPGTPGRRRAGGISYKRTINKDQILLYIHTSKYWTTDSRLCYPRILNHTALIKGFVASDPGSELRDCKGWRQEKHQKGLFKDCKSHRNEPLVPKHCSDLQQH